MKSIRMQTDDSRGGGSVRRDLLTAARQHVSTVPISFFAYYGCGIVGVSLNAACCHVFKTMTVSDPDHRNLFRSLLHILFLGTLCLFSFISVKMSH